MYDLQHSWASAFQHPVSQSLSLTQVQDTQTFSFSADPFGLRKHFPEAQIFSFSANLFGLRKHFPEGQTFSSSANIFGFREHFLAVQTFSLV
jgi:hypothetical protein